MNFKFPVDHRNKDLDAKTFGSAKPQEVEAISIEVLIDSVKHKLGDPTIVDKVGNMYHLLGSTGKTETLTREELLDVIDPKRMGPAFYKHGIFAHKKGPFVHGKPFSKWLHPFVCKRLEIGAYSRDINSSSEEEDDGMHLEEVETDDKEGKKVFPQPIVPPQPPTPHCRKRQRQESSSSSVLGRCISVHMGCITIHSSTPSSQPSPKAASKQEEVPPVIFCPKKRYIAMMILEKQ